MESDSDFGMEDSDVNDEEEQLNRLTAVLQEEGTTDIVSSLHSWSKPPTPLTCAGTSTSCIDSDRLAKIEAALSANKLLEEKARQLERVLTTRLRECRERLRVIQITPYGENKSPEIFRYINCGRPYFKDRMNFPAPDNEDAKMAKSEMYDFSLVISVPGWTVRDKSHLITQIHKMSIDIKRHEINSKINELKRKLKNPKSKQHQKQLDKEIAILRREYNSLSRKPLSAVALPINQEYDWDLLANKLNRRHTPQEYQALWKLFFHPSINKSSWSKTEHNALQKIASENGQQDWDDIAQKLNTNRTGYQCFVYYRTNMNNVFIGRKWTTEEVTYLKRLIEYFKEDNYIPWGKIAAAMENRTKIQIYNKYLRLIEQRKGRFLPEEDAVIFNCVNRFGPNFKRMTSYLPGRSMVQIRTRYQVLSKKRLSTVWTVEDDKKLMQIMANQDSMNFSNATKHFPGKNRVKIRSRYVTLQKWTKKYPHLDIEHAPRRGARRLNHGRPSDNLNEAIENLKNILNTEVETKAKGKRINRESSEAEIEDAIVATLVTEYVKQMETKKITEDEQPIVLSQHHVVSKSDFNMTNLRKCLIFLNSALKKNLYEKTKYAKNYPNLGDNSQDVSLVRVKSYSRQNKVQAVKDNNSPNVWGRPTLSSKATRNYVMPPNYATITGCKALLTLMSTSNNVCDSVNLHVLVRRNPTLKDQLHILLERFFILFTWPLLLSNEGPSELTQIRMKSTESVFTRPPLLPVAPAVTINVKCMKKYKTKDNSGKIDLEQVQDEVSVQEIVDEADDCPLFK